MAAGFIFWVGALPGAIRDALPSRWKVSTPNEGYNVLLLAWSAVFLFFGAFSRDALLLAAPVPALAVLCANHLANAVEKNDPLVFKKFIALEIVLIVLFLFVALPLFFATGGSTLQYTLISVIPWGFFCLLFLLAGRKYARTHQPRKLILFASLLSLLSLLPLAGVFDLLAENLSARGAGLYLRSEMAPGNVLFQYSLHRPSLFFYVGRYGQPFALINAPVNQRIVGQNTVSAGELNNIWLDNDRVFILVRRNQSPPLPSVVNFLHESDGFIVLSNWMDRVPPSP